MPERLRMQRRSWMGAALGAALGWAGMPAQAQRRYQLMPVPAGLRVPTLEAPDLQGQTWRLPEQRGRVVILNFWATWCPPCRAEMPSLQQLEEFYGSDKLKVLAVNVQESPQRVARFLQASGLKLTALLDLDGSISKRWAAQALPTSYVIDSSGQPRWRLLGEVDWNAPEIAELVDPLLAARGPRS